MEKNEMDRTPFNGIYMSMNVDNTDSKGATITALTGSHVKGTFSGKAVWTDTDIVAITNGKFDINIKTGDWED